MAKKVVKNANAKLLAIGNGLCKLLLEEKPDRQLVTNRFSKLASMVGTAESARELIANVDPGLLDTLNKILHPGKAAKTAPK